MAVTEQQVREAVESPAFSHSRRGDGCWRDLVWIYHRDQTSPSGYVCALGADAAVADRIIRELRSTSALSPTERY